MIKKFYLLFLLLISLLFVSCATLPQKDNSSKFSRKYETIAVDEKLDYLETKIRYKKPKNLGSLKYYFGKIK